MPPLPLLSNEVRLASLGDASVSAVVLKMGNQDLLALSHLAGDAALHIHGMVRFQPQISSALLAKIRSSSSIDGFVAFELRGAAPALRLLSSPQNLNGVTGVSLIKPQGQRKLHVHGGQLVRHLPFGRVDDLSACNGTTSAFSGKSVFSQTTYSPSGDGDAVLMVSDSAVTSRSASVFLFEDENGGSPMALLLNATASGVSIEVHGGGLVVGDLDLRDCS